MRLQILTTLFVLLIAGQQCAVVSQDTKKSTQLRIALIGDSTVASYANPPADRPDLTGWGQVFGEFFGDEVEVRNFALSGRSSKSFLREGRWQPVLDTKPDYVFIQFGHNDQPGKGDRTTDPETDFQDNLRRYINDIRKLNAQPVLVTPVARRTFENDKPVTTLTPYVAAIQKVGRETNVPVIDLHGASFALYARLGDAGSADLSAAVSDRTHFSRKGGLAIARLVAQAISAKVPELSSHLKHTALAVPQPLPVSMPWDLKKLNVAPAHEWLDKQSPVWSLFYEGEPYRGKPTRVFAYYASPATFAGTPTRTTKYPAVVLIHGGGGTAFRDWVELWAKRGYAAIAMDLAGSRPIEGKNAHQRENRTRLDDGGPDQGDDEKFGSIDQTAVEQWPYHAVAAVIRAHSLIRSFPEVDADRTAATGISWGGYLTCIVAGVDSRFRAAVPVYGCGFLQDNSAWLSRLGRMTAAQRERWVELWDPSRYLPSVSMPILFVNGTNDFAYPLDSYMKSYDVVPGEKAIRITVNMPHGHPPGWAPPEIGLFIDSKLRGGTALPTVSAPQVEKNRVRFSVSTLTKLTQAALHWTTDSGPMNMRSWQTQPALIEGNIVSAEAPPQAAMAWFVTITDERGAILSSRVQLKD